MTGIPKQLAQLAESYGEPSLHASGGVKSVVAIGEHYVFKVVEAGKQADADHKEQRVLDTLTQRLAPWAQALVPRAVAGTFVEGLGFVEVHTRLEGSTPNLASDELCMALGKFLRALHDCSSFEAVSEFEGEQHRAFLDYLVDSADKFQAKLDGLVGREDERLVQEAVDLVRDYAGRSPTPPPLVLVHKDLSLRNLLVSGTRLTGVIDWAAAQTAPREWEFAILQQRFGPARDVIQGAYGLPLEPELLRVCGALQAIRFWKSFVHDEAFVQDQRSFLRRVL
jgi:aminoglycoside phosphotransferase (APT) family kinase protein